MNSKKSPKTTQKTQVTQKTQKSPSAIDEKALTLELKIHAKALGLPAGSAEIFIKKSLTAAKKSLKNRQIIPRPDLVRAVAKELKKYNADLAYVFENYDKII